MRLLIFFFIIFICKRGSGTTYQCDTTSSCGCSASSTILSRIVGGEIATTGSWSWTVSIREDGYHFCGGTIISPLFIVTAAHCVEAIQDLSHVTILAGSITLVPSSSNKVYEIRSIVQASKHPSYDADTFTNDIALLRLSSPLNMTSANLKPVCLPTGTTVQPPDNSHLIAVGWGTTSMFSQTASPILRQVTVESIASTVSSCNSALKNSQLQFCAGLIAGGKDTCQGDSGGPLMSFVNGIWQLDGVTSYGYGCALPGYPGVYTRVTSFIKWIKSMTQSFEIKTTSTTKKPTTTTATKKRPTTTTITKKRTTTKKPTTKTTRKPTTGRKASSQRSILGIAEETVSNARNLTTEKNIFAGSPLQTSNSAQHSTVQSLFIISFLPVITVAYSFFLLFLL